MRKFAAPLTLSLAFLGMLVAGLVTSAHATQTMSPDDGNWLDLARPVFDAIMAKQYIPAVAFALVLSVALVKRYAPEWKGLRKFVHSDPGGVLTTFLMSYFGAFGTAAAATGSGWAGLTLAVAKTSGLVALAAIGGYVGVKKFLLPLLQPLMNKAPSWMQPLFTFVFWAFDKKLAAAETERKADEAGDAAVADKPSTGVDGVLGAPTDVK